MLERSFSLLLFALATKQEADALCTRIGIMVNGELRSLGTPQQLKQRYGAGYRVVVRRTEAGAASLDGGDGGDGGQLRTILAQKYGNDSVAFVASSSTQTVQVYGITTDDLRLGPLFALLEEHREKLAIQDYSVSQTTMEQVFTKFAQYQAS